MVCTMLAGAVEMLLHLYTLHAIYTNRSSYHRCDATLEFRSGAPDARYMQEQRLPEGELLDNQNGGKIMSDSRDNASY